jgi:threonine dehydrogenase-like Zn-dependent dehydrogenase
MADYGRRCQKLQCEPVESGPHGGPVVGGHQLPHKLWLWRILSQPHSKLYYLSATMSATNPGRIAIVGTGSRGLMWVNGIAERPNSVVVALCDTNPVRSQYYNQVLKAQGRPKAPVFTPEQFEKMLAKEKVDTVVVTTVDATHHLYIIPALEAGGKRDSVIRFFHDFLSFF